ncbi:MAG: Isopentenyl-diphosphate delta-isomerase [Syntrophorhabdaceae bacterium PtaU1.Bin034]|nr:MAG: Isopentenyl-diphosphate delta-isomerase [Syntrophorhabdaceae bacterium PtaU1.Bin034]
MSYSHIKDVHLEVCLNHRVESDRRTGLENVDLVGGFPDFSFSDMDTSIRFLGKTLSLPLMIAPITGGGSRSGKINRNLAQAAERCRIAMALGSERPMLEKKVGPESYLIREFAPSIPLLGNLGLMHAKRGKDYLLEAVESIGADGIILYVNPLHEILQADGERDFRGSLDALAVVLDDFPYPVFLKEVGCGLPESVIRWAGANKIAGVDTAGLGGTNWARIEGIIQGKDYTMYECLGGCTRDVIVAARKWLKKSQCLIASGGIRSGVDMAKALALGANLASMALPFLKWAENSADEVVRGIEKLKEELLVALWFCGCRTTGELKGAIA